MPGADGSAAAGRSPHEHQFTESSQTRRMWKHPHRGVPRRTCFITANKETETAKR
jgi:hypothetical protein